VEWIILSIIPGVAITILLDHEISSINLHPRSIPGQKFRPLCLGLYPTRNNYRHLWYPWDLSRKRPPSLGTNAFRTSPAQSKDLSHHSQRKDRRTKHIIQRNAKSLRVPLAAIPPSSRNALLHLPARPTCPRSNSDFGPRRTLPHRGRAIPRCKSHPILLFLRPRSDVLAITSTERNQNNWGIHGYKVLQVVMTRIIFFISH
jgi:hypothetical protein